MDITDKPKVGGKYFKIKWYFEEIKGRFFGSFIAFSIGREIDLKSNVPFCHAEKAPCTINQPLFPMVMSYTIE